MKNQNEFRPSSSSVHKPLRNSFWQKLGAGSLSISLIFHGVLAAVGVVWVFSIIPQAEEPNVIFTPKSVGAPSASQTKLQHSQAQLLQPKPSSIVAVGALGAISLPDPEISQIASSLSGIASSSLASGQTSAGMSAVAIGANHGLPSVLSNANGITNPFGETKVNENALLGKFYDLKQNKRREPTGFTDDQMRKKIQEFVKNDWRDRILADYFSPKQSLYLTKFYIPKIPAQQAPAAFDCEKEVQPSKIMMIYRGTVSPPKSGKYRFVGGGDDILAVRFNNKNVFDHGYSMATTGLHREINLPYLKDQKIDRNLEKLMKDSPMKPPVTFYQYATTLTLNSEIDGLAVGPTFEAEEGQEYPIEILIAEIPGGYFSAVLLIEEIGVKYAKASTGAPIFPLFRLSPSEPEKSQAESTPPYDPTGIPWKLVSQGGRVDIE